MKRYLLADQKLISQQLLFLTSISALCFATICLFVIDNHSFLPFVLITYALLNFLSLGLFQFHRNINRVYMEGTVLGFITLVLINLFSGGVDGVFNSFFLILVITSYSVRRRYGRIWTALTVIYFMIFYLLDANFVHQLNEVTSEVRPIFIFLSVLICALVLGGVNGEYLVRLILAERVKVKEISQINIEKEAFLEEIHHRVKKNMGIISDLLSFQSSFIEEPKIKEYFQLSQDRIRTMVVVHDLLYRESDFSRINIQTYLHRLVSENIDLIKGVNNNVVLNLDIPNVSLNIETALPLGVFVNEVVSNSLNYGICKDEVGTLSIQLEAIDYVNFVLRISDDGKGMDRNIDMNTTNARGLKLIRVLAKSLKGKVVLNHNKMGTYYILNFMELTPNRKAIAS